MLVFNSVPSSLPPKEELSTGKPNGRLPFVPHQGYAIAEDQGTGTVEVFQDDTIVVLGRGDDLESLTQKDVISLQPVGFKPELTCSLSRSEKGLLVTDQQGSVILLRDSEVSEESSTRQKRSRGEEEQSSSMEQILVSSSSAKKSDKSLVSGWNGWSHAELDPANPSRLVSAREYFKDIRITDLSRGSSMASDELVSSFQTSSFITSMRFFDEGNTLCCAEDDCISMWDLRIAPKSALVKKIEQRGVVQAVPVPKFARGSLLVSGGQDRAVLLWDRRKWTKVKIEKNVLKYSIRTVAPVVTGNSLSAIVGGIDSEARVLELTASATTAVGKAREEDAPLEGAFRQRLKTACHCSGSWRGGFSCVGDVAVGISVANEIFRSEVLQN